MIDETLSISLTDEWKLYIDQIPEGFDVLGIVTRSYCETGALLHHVESNRFYQMNRINYRSLDKKSVWEALEKVFNEKEV